MKCPTNLGATLSCLAFLASACAELPDPPVEPQVVDANVLDVQTLDAGSSGGDGSVRENDAELPPGDAASMIPPPICMIPEGACDPRSSEGCGDAFTCLISAGGTSCADQRTLSIAEGESCAYAHDCSPGLSCVSTRERGPICRRPCCSTTGDADCREGERCAWPVSDAEGSGLPGWGVCRDRRACELLASESTCEEGEACYVVAAERDTECRSAGELAVGAVCRSVNDCRAGLYCQERMSGVGSCVRLCDLDSDTCPMGEGRCREFALVPEGYGLCLVDAAARE